MIAKSLLVLGASNFIAFNLLQKLSAFSYYRVAAADVFKNNFMSLLNDNILFEEISSKQDILKKYQFDIIIEFENEFCLRIFLQYKDQPDIIVNISNCYGVFQDKESFIMSLVLSSIHQEFLKIYKDGTLQSDLIYVDDVTDAILKIIHFGDKTKYDISSSTQYKDVNVARMILKKMQLPMTLVEYESLEIDNLIRKTFDNSKLIKLGWKPKVSLDTGLNLVIKWLEKNDV